MRGADCSGGLLTVHIDAIAANFRKLQSMTAAACAAVVKADAYGLGAAEVVPALRQAGCRDLFVAYLSEAQALPAADARACDVYILNGLMPGTEQLCAQTAFIPVLNSLQQIAAWKEQSRQRGRVLPAALQIDSGMSRLGLGVQEVNDLVSAPAMLDGINIRLVMSHLACADDPRHEANVEQLAAFAAARSLFPSARGSLANSAGTLLTDEYHFDLARPGIALYGVNPLRGSNIRLQRVVGLDARVVQIRAVPAGTSVGYGYTHRCGMPSRLATLGIGYADGWFRALGNGVASAFFEDHALPIVGRVSMDSMTIDISALPEDALHAGDMVELIGDHQSLDELAARIGTIPYEILTGLGRRYERRYLVNTSRDWHAGKSSVA